MDIPTLIPETPQTLLSLTPISYSSRVHAKSLLLQDTPLPLPGTHSRKHLDWIQAGIDKGKKRVPNPPGGQGGVEFGKGSKEKWGGGWKDGEEGQGLGLGRGGKRARGPEEGEEEMRRSKRRKESGLIGREEGVSRKSKIKGKGGKRMGVWSLRRGDEIP